MHELPFTWFAVGSDAQGLEKKGLKRLLYCNSMANPFVKIWIEKTFTLCFGIFFDIIM